MGPEGPAPPVLEAAPEAVQVGLSACIRRAESRLSVLIPAGERHGSST